MRYLHCDPKREPHARSQHYVVRNLVGEARGVECGFAEGVVGVGVSGHRQGLRCGGCVPRR